MFFIASRHTCLEHRQLAKGGAPGKSGYYTKCRAYSSSTITTALLKRWPLTSRTRGVDARTAIGCDEALRCVKDWVPDVVVLDIMMPERDGYETASALRDYLPTHSLGIVAFTSLDQDHVKETGRARHNFDGYCQKGDGAFPVTRADAQHLARVAQCARNARLASTTLRAVSNLLAGRGKSLRQCSRSLQSA